MLCPDASILHEQLACRSETNYVALAACVLPQHASRNRGYKEWRKTGKSVDANLPSFVIFCCLDHLFDNKGVNRRCQLPLSLSSCHNALLWGNAHEISDHSSTPVSKKNITELHITLVNVGCGASTASRGSTHQRASCPVYILRASA